MNGYYFTFRSITSAQKGQRALEQAGIHSTLSRTPAKLSRQGCGYGLRTAAGSLSAAVPLLRPMGLQKCYLRDTLEEVDCAVF